MPRPIRALDISSEQRRALRVIVNRPTVAQRDHRRAWIILNRANGLSQMETARKVGVGRRVVIHWEQQFRQTGVAGLSEAKLDQAFDMGLGTLRKTLKHIYDGESVWLR